jgi:hypothetical protein
LRFVVFWFFSSGLLSLPELLAWLQTSKQKQTTEASKQTTKRTNT